ncbi:MAG: alpha/beta hydrolase [Dokdonella sp.]|uniref:alpha/beta fold hydrolase n=1 Tax=Dokdonella sp. TaxID=2291710 RepID=UPI003263861C
MPRAEEYPIACGQLTLAAKCWGDPALPPLLALHGWLDNAGSFDLLAPLLSTDWHVVAIDLRGHGRSPHIAEGAWYHYTDHFDEIRAIADHFGWERVDLLGHSLGGSLASLFAALYPERVGHLLLIEALRPLAGGADESLSQLRRSIDQRATFGARKSLRVHPDLDSAISVRMRAGNLSERAARALVERGTLEVDGGVIWSSDARLMLASAQRYTEAQILSMLAGIQSPTLVVLADPPTSYLPREMIDQRAAQVANINVVDLPGYHHLHMDNAPAVAAAIRTFRDAHTT